MRLHNAFTNAKWLRDMAIERNGNPKRLPPPVRRQAKRIVANLRALPDDPSPDEVDAVFKSLPEGSYGSSNRVSRTIVCHECQQGVPEVIEVTNGDEYNGRVNVCAACITKMLKLIDG